MKIKQFDFPEIEPEIKVEEKEQSVSPEKTERYKTIDFNLNKMFQQK